MKKLIPYIFLFVLGFSCTKNAEEITYPACFESQLQIIYESPVQSTKSNIKKYSYQNNAVYVLERNIGTDESYAVVDENCNVICEFGVWTSNTCDLNDLIFIETVWEDPR